MKKVYGVLLVCLAFFTLVACNKAGVEEGTFNIVVGETKEVTTKGIKKEEATFKSSNEEVVLIDDNGSYIGISPGLSTVTVTYKDDSWSLFVIVSGDRIEINSETQININILDTFELVYQENDPNGVSFKSLDEEILTVDENGLITTIKPGETEVVVVSNTNPNVSKTIAVRVLSEDEILYDINLETETLNINYRQSKKINVTTNDPKGVSFQSLDETIVDVDHLGNAKGLNEGKTQIQINSITNPNVSKILTVNVIDNRLEHEINFEEAISNTLSLDNYTLEFNINENFENINYFYTLYLMFDDNLTKFKASQVEEYYEISGDKQYAYYQTESGFVKEEVESNNSGSFLLYENFTSDAFMYNEYTDKYLLDAGNDIHAKLLDDFISLFTTDGVILNFGLTINDGFIDMMDFMFIYDEYLFSIEIRILDIDNTIVEVPLYV